MGIYRKARYVGDIDGDGIGEFVDYDSDNYITEFYDGQNHNLKWTITGNEFEDNIFDADANVHPAYLKFPAIDFNGDGKREVFFIPSDGKGILIIDVVNNITVFEWSDANIYKAEFDALSDVDGDGSLELVFITETDNFPNPSTYKTYVYSTGIQTTSIKEIDGELPGNFKLSQNFPNPFNPSTTIRYSLTSPEKVSIKIYDVAGQLVKEFINEHMQSGEYEVIWKGIDNYGYRVSSGTYFYQLTIDNFAEAKKMILLK